jgi:hypothetical protein
VSGARPGMSYLMTLVWILAFFAGKTTEAFVVARGAQASLVRNVRHAGADAIVHEQKHDEADGNVTVNCLGVQELQNVFELRQVRVEVVEVPEQHRAYNRH